MVLGLGFSFLSISGEVRILEVVPKSEPREKGRYWGYTVRHASCLSTVISDSPFPVCLLFITFLQMKDKTLELGGLCRLGSGHGRWVQSVGCTLSNELDFL